MSSEPIEIDAADLAAMPRAEVRGWVLGLVRSYTEPLDRADLADRFAQHYDQSQTLPELLKGTEEDASLFLLAIGGLIDVLVNPMRLVLQALGRAIDPETEEGRRLQGQARHLRKAAEALRELENHDLAARNEDEAAVLESRLTYRPPGAPQSLLGAVCCELDRLFRENTELRTGRRLELIAGLATDFVKPATADGVRNLLRDTRRRDAGRPGPKVFAVLRGITTITTEGAEPAPGVEVFHDPKPDPGHFAGVAVKIVSLDPE